MSTMKDEIPTPEDWLRTQLQRKRMTQAEFSKRAGVSKSSITRFKQGDAQAETAILIARGLRVPVTEVLLVTGKWTPPRGHDEELEEITPAYRFMSQEDRHAVLSFVRFIRDTD